jgi:cytosine permease
MVMKEARVDGAAKALDALYEFEREPVSEDKLQPGKYFAGLFAGEHVAGTEFVIGAMFVQWGVRPFDIVVGLLLGNALAVLTWTLLCAPIAVSTRLTLYWYLRRVTGPFMTTIYNIVNAVMFCILAGCMITVSASAIRIPFGIPEQTQWYPEDFRFVMVVLAVGAVVTVLAILGFKRLAQFSVVSSPWMFAMFIAGAVVLLPKLALLTTEVGEIRSIGDFWRLMGLSVWTGPEGVASPMSFWKVAAFAWICNLAMNAGLSDMAILRYAKSSWYGLYTAFGVFLGHYLAWICAGIMGAATALALQRTMTEIDPGTLANYALGVSGIIAVVLAGWTTSNPTLYRAGLAIQTITPGWARWKVTLAVGVVTSIVACFPFVFTKLLDFVGYYGIILMPAGAIVFAEHWLLPKLGVQRFWATSGKRTISWPSLLSWGIAVAVAVTLQQTGILHLFFLFVPIWVLTVVLYLVFALMAGAKNISDTTEETGLDETPAPATQQSVNKASEPVDALTKIAGLVSLLSLICCFLWPLYILYHGVTGYEDRFAFFKAGLIVPTILYFVGGVFYLSRRDKEPAAS